MEVMSWYKIAQEEYDYEKTPQKELQGIAGSFENDNQVAPDPGAGQANEFHWVYFPEFPIERFLSGNMSSEEWVMHFDNEQKMAAEDGREGYYDDMILKPIKEPIVAVDLGSEMAIWDGYHRVGASFKKGAKTIRAIIGKRL